MQLTDDYGAYRLTSKSGKRLLITGDNVKFEAGYGTGGVADAVYRYLGPNGRVDLGAEDFANTARWAKLGGEAGATYQYQGPSLGGGTLDLRNVDYTTSDWFQVGGVEGAVYQWMGPNVDPLVGDRPPDAELPRPALLEARARHRAAPVGDQHHRLELDRGRLDRRLQRRPHRRAGADPNATVTAASVHVEAQLTAFIRSTADVSGVSSGGNCLNNGGTSLALGFVIATNVILSNALAEIDETPVTATSRRRRRQREQPVADRRAGEELDPERRRRARASRSRSTRSAGSRRTSSSTRSTRILGDSLIADAFHNSQPAAGDRADPQLARPAARHVRVSSVNEAIIQAEVTNKATTTVVVITGSTALAVGVAIASNMINCRGRVRASSSTRPALHARRPPLDPSRPATGSRSHRARSTSSSARARAGRRPTTPRIPTSCSQLASPPAAPIDVHAEDAADIEASIVVEAISTAQSTGGIDLIVNLLSAAQTDYQYTTHSGMQHVKPGELIRADDGKVYRYVGHRERRGRTRRDGIAEPVEASSTRSARRTTISPRSA